MREGRKGSSTNQHMKIRNIWQDIVGDKKELPAAVGTLVGKSLGLGYLQKKSRRASNRGSRREKTTIRYEAPPRRGDLGPKRRAKKDPQKSHQKNALDGDSKDKKNKGIFSALS